MADGLLCPSPGCIRTGTSVCLVVVGMESLAPRCADLPANDRLDRVAGLINSKPLIWLEVLLRRLITGLPMLNFLTQRPRLSSGAIATPGRPASKESRLCTISVERCEQIVRLKMLRREADKP